MARPGVPFSRLVDSLGNIAREWRDFLVPAVGNWTPAANNIAFAAAMGQFVRRGQQVDVYFDVTWPANADGAAAQVHGLPIAAGPFAAIAVGYTNLGTPITTFVRTNTAQIEVATFAGAALTNAALSGARLIGSGSYLL